MAEKPETAEKHSKAGWHSGGGYAGGLILITIIFSYTSGLELWQTWIALLLCLTIGTLLRINAVLIDVLDELRKPFRSRFS